MPATRRSAWRASNNFVVGDRITVDQAANGYGKGDPETRTITAAPATGQLTLDQPLSRNHANARFVEGSRAGTSTHDTQGSNLGWWWTQKDGPQTAQAFTYWGWRYLQILPPGAGETPQISAVVQHSAAPRNRRATFDSDNATLDAVFELMQRSGIYSSEEVFLDTPTREKGQFTGDTVDISYANMIASGDRNASARAIREIVYSATHSWKAASNGYCTAAQLPCSYPSIGTPGRVNAVYPNGDNMRDIPDYTLMMPDWVWRYYEQSGDKALLASSYETLKSVANYVKTNIATHRQRRGPGLQPVRRHQLLPVRDHRLAGADALRLHVQRQRGAHDPQRARGRHPARHGQGRARAGQAGGRRGLRRLGG